MSAERLDSFMSRANAAYYATHDPFRDFTTAPEISQVFGELLGAWAAVVWAQMGQPNPVLLAEAGPGRGTLMADALRAAGQVAPAFRAALHVHFIETSPRLRAIQARNVPAAVWHDDVGALPAAPMVLLANEFLDALPIRQFEQRGSTWHERYVQNGVLTLRPATAEKTPLPPLREREGPAAQRWEGVGAQPAMSADIFEWCEAAEAWSATVAARLARDGGAALILDYGGGTGDTLQALRGGKPADPFEDPGMADLTAHVDFPAIVRAAQAQGAATSGPVTQGVFLAQLGLHERTEILARANPARAAMLREAAARLAAPDRMGTLFKAAAITHPGLPPPPGFEH